jgi:hypothetical protein
MQIAQDNSETTILLKLKKKKKKMCITLGAYNRCWGIIYVCQCFVLQNTNIESTDVDTLKFKRTHTLYVT